MDDESNKFYALIHPGGIGGAVLGKPEMREQDAFAEDGVGYIVTFFPRITRIGNARISTRDLATFSQTPEAAITKFMDGILKTEKWETYHHAGHRVRKVKIVDLGDAE